MSEARKVIRERTPRADLDNIRAFVRQLRESDDLDEAAANAVFDALARFQQYVQNEKIAAPKRIEALLHDPAIEVFHLDEAMLERSVQLSAETALELQSFDVAILAAIVVPATDLHAAGDEVSFCTLDTDLQPWDRNGKRKHELANLLDTAGIWVYADFLLETPPRPGP